MGCNVPCWLWGSLCPVEHTGKPAVGSGAWPAVVKNIREGRFPGRSDIPKMLSTRGDKDI